MADQQMRVRAAGIETFMFDPTAFALQKPLPKAARR